MPFFAEGASSFLQSLSATHPPLEKRIRRIDPRWDGKFDHSDATDRPQGEGGTPRAQATTPEEIAKKIAAGTAGVASVAAADLLNAVDQIGNPREETIRYARELLSDLPAAVKEAAREPYGARAVMYSLVLDQGQEVRDKQLKQLQVNADRDVYTLTLKLMTEMDGLEPKFRLPLIDIAMPALKALSRSQYKTFRRNLLALIEADAKVELLEWSLQKILFSHLDGQFFKLSHVRAIYSQPAQIKQEIALVLSVLAYAGQQRTGDAEQAFASAAKVLVLPGLSLVAKNSISLPGLDAALDKLTRLKPLAKPGFLKACVASIVHDQLASPVEVELLRAFADVLDCPMPPVV